MAVKRYDGSQWVTVAGKGDQGTSSSIATWVKTATGGETSVSGNDDNSQPLSYTVGQELVFINGALQKRGSDYTATTGNSITGLTALAANDVVTVWTVNAFSVTNAISSGLVTTTGDMIYASGANTPARLAIGSTDQVLKVSGGIPAWGAPTGGMTLLETMSLSGSSVTSATIPGTYTDLLLVVKNVYGSAQSQLDVRFNGDTGTNYYSRRFRNVNGTVSATTAAAASRFTDFITFDTSATAYNKAFAVFRVFRYADTDITYIETTGTFLETDYRSMTGQMLYDNAAAITSVTFLTSAGTFSGGTVYIYGVK